MLCEVSLKQYEAEQFWHFCAEVMYHIRQPQLQTIAGCAMTFALLTSLGSGITTTVAVLV